MTAGIAATAVSGRNENVAAIRIEKPITTPLLKENTPVPSCSMRTPSAAESWLVMMKMRRHPVITVGMVMIREMREKSHFFLCEERLWKNQKFL